MYQVSTWNNSLLVNRNLKKSFRFIIAYVPNLPLKPYFSTIYQLTYMYNRNDLIFFYHKHNAV